MNISILYGQLPAHAGKDDQDTWSEVQRVEQALRQMGHAPAIVPVSLNLQATLETLQEQQPDMVFNLVETLECQGRLIHLAPSVLDVLHMPYTGARTEAIFLTSNKLLAKQFLQGAGFPTPCWVDDSAAPRRIPPPAGRYILKSVWEHASVGLSDDSVINVRTGEELQNALERSRETLRGQNFAEQYIEGREFNLALLDSANGPELLPPAEICFEHYPEGKLNIVDYRAKWEEDSFEYQHTPRHFDFPDADEPLLQQLRSLALACWNLFSLRGYARVDFRVDATQQPWILEINTNPCLSPDAGFMAAAEQAGLTLTDVLTRILHASL